MSIAKVAKIRVSRGLSTNIPFGYEVGRLFVTMDTRQLYVGQGLNQPLLLISGNNAGLTFRGPWVISGTYLTNDLVTFNNALFIAVQDNSGAQPDISPSDWDLVIDGNVANNFVFNQSLPSATWVIPHNLNLQPLSVVVEDSTNTEVFVETHFDSPNQVTLKFSAPESGRATCIA